MPRKVEITPTAAKIIQQLPMPEREEIERALRDTDKLTREARKLRSAGDDVWVARVRSRRLLFKIENSSLLVVGVYDQSYLDSAS